MQKITGQSEAGNRHWELEKSFYEHKKFGQKRIHFSFLNIRRKGVSVLCSFSSQNVSYTFCNNSGMRVVFTQIKFKLNVSKNRNEERETGQSFLELHPGL